MLSSSVSAVVAVTLLTTGAVLLEPPRPHNPVVELLAAKMPAFGLYAPSNRRFGPSSTASAPAAAPKSPLDLAREAVAYTAADYIFDGSLEHDFEGAFPEFSTFMKAMSDAGVVDKHSTTARLTHPLFVKMNEIAPDVPKAQERIARQLNLGVSGVVFVDVRSADEAKAGLLAMRFKSKGGVRPDAVGSAPAFWGLSEKDYREKADLWPVNPEGQLVNFTIIESREGLARVREIAAVKGIGVLFPGAGTLRGVFTTTGPNGQRKFDAEAWEAAIQTVLRACKEFSVPCGYPARAEDIEMRIKQGFSVFVIGWGENGFRTVEVGRRIGGRTPINE
jgi:4-hydroxy-2-oxoheptanedioate aldolase